VDSPEGVIGSHGCAEAWLWDELEGSDVEEEQKIDDGDSDSEAREAIAHKWGVFMLIIIRAMWCIIFERRKRWKAAMMGTG
jgi:hypothetical protein